MTTIHTPSSSRRPSLGHGFACLLAFACACHSGDGGTTDSTTDSTTTAAASTSTVTGSSADPGSSASATSGSDESGASTTCTRDPAHDTACKAFWAEFDEDLPKAWMCPEDDILQGGCSSTAIGAQMWAGYCCPADFMP
jgi:hypothetical protein